MPITRGGSSSSSGVGSTPVVGGYSGGVAEVWMDLAVQREMGGGWEGDGSEGGMQACRHAGMRACGHAGMLACRHAGMQAYRLKEAKRLRERGRAHPISDM